jgi:hypothetical protein
MSWSKRFSGVAWVIGGLAVPGFASAQGGPLGDEGRTWFSLYGTAASWSTTTRSDNGFTENFRGTTVNVEDELGVQRRKAAAGLAFGRRIGENWRFEMDWTTSSRSGNALLKRDIRVGTYVYASGSQLQSTINVSGLRINGGRSFVRSDDVEFGVSFGGQWVTISRSFNRVSANGSSAALDFSTSNTSVAPLPILGVYGTWAPTPAVQLTGRAEVGLRGGGYGQLSVGALWRATTNFSVGAGLRHTQGNIDEQFVSNTLVLNYRATGPQLVLNFSF